MADTDKTAYVEAWFDQFAAESGYSRERMLDAAEDWLNTGEYWCEGGEFEGHQIPNEFWVHYKTLTGRQGDGSFFTCSC